MASILETIKNVVGVGTEAYNIVKDWGQDKQEEFAAWAEQFPEDAASMTADSVRRWRNIEEGPTSTVRPTTSFAGETKNVNASPQEVARAEEVGFDENGFRMSDVPGESSQDRFQREANARLLRDGKLPIQQGAVPKPEQPPTSPVVQPRPAQADVFAGGNDKKISEERAILPVKIQREDLTGSPAELRGAFTNNNGTAFSSTDVNNLSTSDKNDLLEKFGVTGINDDNRNAKIQELYFLAKTGE